MYNIQHISRIVSHNDSFLPNPSHKIRHLVIDSRKLLFPDQSIFFAFVGNQTDGHLFIDELYHAGVCSFVIEDPDFNRKAYPKANFLIVNHSLLALQELAAYHRKKYQALVIGITGSNGKTIIKEWIYQLLENTYKIIKSPGSYNSQIGVPLSVWQIASETDLAIIEAGVSKNGEMHALARIITPEIGIFTNLGDAHSSGFRNKHQKLLEKLKLFEHSDKIIYQMDDEMVDTAIKQNFSERELIGWSFEDKNASFYVPKIIKNKNSSEVYYQWKGKEDCFKIPFKDRVSIRMAIFSVLSALSLGIDPKLISKKSPFLSAINMRLETKDGINNCLLINDSYNADITSFTQAMHFLSMQDENKGKTLILSDFYQLGLEPETLNKKLATLIDKQKLTQLFLVGENVKSIPKYLSEAPKTFLFPDTDTLIKSIKNLDFQNEVILLKGARKFTFEKIFSKLASRYHSTVLEINLDAITQNLLVYSALLKPATRKLAVIKASGYGAGSIKLARHMEKNNVNYFAVAFVDEGIELRNGGIKTPIMVFNADLAFLKEIIDFQLEPVVFSFEYLEQIISEAPEGMGIHLKIDSGLNRLGFQEKDWPALCTKLEGLKSIRVISVFSHFSASPTAKYDSFSHHQAAIFNKGYERIINSLNYRPIKHLLNSAGVVKFPEYQFDMVRMGSGIHGIDTSDQISSALQVVHTLKAKINMIKSVKAGDSIGYERMGISNVDRKIAIIPIGYADGLVRKAGNARYSVWINSTFAPIVGNVNMDMTMIDISAIPNVETGDEVEIFGPNNPIQKLAKAGDTIFYEILSRISPRVKRIYTTS